ncbi:PREDICTED: zinc finger CCCH domain-containing protein 52-like [Nicotiana attenuata]|uniref:zinc finger CCCH domain-containing protein 52-like n=1 Tax=Nicotiana attenuata TaxID=49451 RepID=UPI0009054BDE|nr:PREDICTED: zinc finger CCCH domain-containing protein 52-like [Nicotiana attenuata]
MVYGEVAGGDFGHGHNSKVRRRDEEKRRERGRRNYELKRNNQSFATESESFTTGVGVVGSKSKPCMKFFSTSGCSFGEACHYVPGYTAMSQLSNMGSNPAAPVGRNGASFSDGPAPAVKSKSNSGYLEPSRPLPLVYIDASLAGAIIGKNGVNSKQICQLTGVKLSIKEHERDTNKRNVELQGTFDQINQASAMVRERGPKNAAPFTRGSSGPFKTKMCAHFAKGLCTFGEKCHFAIGLIFILSVSAKILFANRR